ncbi:rod shape-determining protein MreC [Deferribacter autotrophicus]|uniref:Cell shape-determining protein MreC n=1 Tax=Deferribacter autotrophicus TaxID=500465 RepID=A0A5A8F360_9BACT|nr:rod shape-determining protein MreC [Deferribacter autotrophicus]KAA0257381.1 rod shape-determining protein MreC [Deferribacter autotrophicus]
MFAIKKRYIFLFLILLFIILMQFEMPQTYRPIKGLLGNILNPFIYLADNTVDFFTSTFDKYINLINVKEENKKLKNELDKLNFENIKLREKLKELDRLKKLLNFKEAFEFNTIACNVIGRNNYGLIKYIIIDRGSNDGLDVDMPVISSKGLVGKVVELYRHSAKVKIVLDRSLKVAVMNFNTRETGVVSGTDYGLLEVNFYSNIGKVNIGDLFITSGFGMLYPKGLPVGVVVKYENEDYGLFKKVYLKPIVDFNKLENVLVILKNEKIQNN